MAAKFFAAVRGGNISAFSPAISSSVSRQSAEKPGVTMARFFTPLVGQRLHGLVGVGLEPLGGAEARLEREHEAAARSCPSRSRSSRAVLWHWQ